MDQLLTARELAKALKVDLRTLYKLAREGKIPAIRVGRGWRFREADVVAAFHQQSIDRDKKS